MTFLLTPRSKTSVTCSAERGNELDVPSPCLVRALILPRHRGCTTRARGRHTRVQGELRVHQRGLRLIALRERVQVNGEHRAFDGEGFDCPGLYNRTTRLLQRVGGIPYDVKTDDNACAAPWRFS